MTSMVGSKSLSAGVNPMNSTVQQKEAEAFIDKKIKERILNIDFEFFFRGLSHDSWGSFNSRGKRTLE